MTKSTALYFTQNIANPAVAFNSADLLSVVAVSPNSNGSNLTAGARTFTAAAGTVQTGGEAAEWTADVTDSRVIGLPVITKPGSYLATPTATSNAATVDSGSSNATWNLRVENIKPLYTAPADGAVVKAINVASLDSAARVMSLWIADANNGNQRLIGAVNIPANSGNNGSAAAIDLLGGTLLPALPYDANGKRVIELKGGQILKVSVPAVTAGTQINVTAQIEEY
jgi:hypothetical protein